MNKNIDTAQKMHWDSLQTQLPDFSTQLHDSLEELGILTKCQKVSIDHVCVRLAKAEDVHNLRKELTATGKVISSVEVNGREIAIIQLHQALSLGSWQTQGLELPFPKQNHNYTDGWEHVEFVLEEADNTMDSIRETFLKMFPKLNKGDLKEKYFYSEDQPHAAGDQVPNPTIGIKVNGIGIKFHACSIQKVVGYNGTDID